MGGTGFIGSDSLEEEFKVEDAEERILKLESRREELMKLLEDPASYGENRGSAIDWNRELVEIEEKLTSWNTKWEKFAEKLADLVDA